ncbi:MAG TPA: hypothetical protein PLZ36_09090 [Armatimonadota bacterium]|nr:hypothetical protein [Armatimonadota bacterium]
MTTDLLSSLRNRWEQEFAAGHRWGRVQDAIRVTTEHGRLVVLWQAIHADIPPAAPLLEQILALEFCNWRLEESLHALCRGIGANTPAPFDIGHIGSCTEERWQRIWAYYLAARAWLPRTAPSGFPVLLTACDPDGATRTHVAALLGEQTPIKALYVERFCLSLEYWLRGWYDMADGGIIGLRAAITAIEQEIRQHDQADDALLWAMDPENGGLFPCLHKLFRRFDIILCSIGNGQWRAGMPEEGSSRGERLAICGRYLSPIDAWRDYRQPEDAFAAAIHQDLGAPTPEKCFLAALLVSLLRSQLLAISGESAVTEFPGIE